MFPVVGLSETSRVTACGNVVGQPVGAIGEPGTRTSRRLSNALIEDARRVFQRQAGEDVTAEDARQMLENLMGFFKVLNDWDRAEARYKTEKALSSEAS